MREQNAIQPQWLATLWMLVPLLAQAGAALPVAAADMVIKVGIAGRIESIDWNRALVTTDAIVLDNIMEGLFELDDHSQAKPVLAESFAVSPDGRRYTFHLRKGIQWSDGKPLVAQQFVDSWQRLLDPLALAPYSYFLDNVVGAREYSRAKTRDFQGVGVKAPDALTLIVELKQPCSYFPQMLSLWATFPIRAELIAKHGLQGWTMPANMVTLGPYLLAAVDENLRYTLKPNPLYHGTHETVGRIEIDVINNRESAMKRFTQGTLDLLMDPIQKDITALRNMSAYRWVPLLRTRFLAFNEKNFPLSLPKVREAFARAIDVARIPQIVRRRVTVANSFLPPEVFPSGAGSVLTFNPTLARELLAQAGLAASNIPTIELVGLNEDENAFLLYFLKEQFENNLKLKISVELVPIDVFRSRLLLGTGSLFMGGWGADYPDPDSFMSSFLSDVNANPLRWKNAGYDELVRTASNLPNGPRRDAAYSSALEILLRTDAAIIPLYFQTTEYLLGPRTDGVHIDHLGVIKFRGLRLR